MLVWTRRGCCRLLLEMWNMGKAASTPDQKYNWIVKGLRLCTDYKVRLNKDKYILLIICVIKMLKYLRAGRTMVAPTTRCACNTACRALGAPRALALRVGCA